MPVQARGIELSELQASLGGWVGWQCGVTAPADLPLACALLPQVREPRIEEMSTVEASLRLDAIASAGFRMSRGKMSEAIKSGEGCLRAWGGGGCAAHCCTRALLHPPTPHPHPPTHTPTHSRPPCARAQAMCG